MNHIYIGIGGWCGTAFGLKGSNLRSYALPFDWIRSKFEGVIDCLGNNFENFLPKTYQKEKNGKMGAYRGRQFSFFHDDFENNLNAEVDKYKRRINRFQELLRSNQRIIFIRTTVTNNYLDEINLSNSFHSAMSEFFPDTNYKLVFIVPEQFTTGFFCRLDEKTYCYTLNDLSHDNKNLGTEYSPIFKSIKEFNLFTNPPPNAISTFSINATSRLTVHRGKSIFI